MTEPRVYGVTVEFRPDGAVLTPADSYTYCLIKDLLGVLDEHPELLDDLCALYADPAPQHDPHLPDRPSRDDELAERLTRALPETSRQIRLHRKGAETLRDRLTDVLRRRGWWAA